MDENLDENLDHMDLERRGKEIKEALHTLRSKIHHLTADFFLEYNVKVIVTIEVLVGA